MPSGYTDWDEVQRGSFLAVCDDLLAMSAGPLPLKCLDLKGTSCMQNGLDGPDSKQTAHGRRILVMSPHPDDDVISMGGTLSSLCQQGNEVRSVLVLPS